MAFDDFDKQTDKMMNKMIKTQITLAVIGGIFSLAAIGLLIWGVVFVVGLF